MFNACANTHSVAFYETTASGSKIEVNSPIKMSLKSGRYILYYKDWKAYNGDATSTITVDGKTYDVIFNFTDKELTSKDISVVQDNVRVSVDNVANEVIMFAPNGVNEIEFYERSDSCETFKYFLENDEYVTYVEAPESRSFGSYKISAESPSEIVEKVIVNKGRYCEKEYTLKVYFGINPFEGIADDLRAIKGTVAFDADGTLRVTRKAGVPDGNGTGIYKETKSGNIVEITEIDGVYTERDDAYVTYVPRNTSNVRGIITIRDTEGNVVYTGDVIIDLGLESGKEEIQDVLKLLRSTATVDADGTLRITRNSGLTSGQGNGIYSLTKNGHTVKLSQVEGDYTDRGDAYIVYVSRNTSNVRGVITVIDDEGNVEYEENVIFDLGLGDEITEPEEPSYDVAGDLKAPLKGTISVSEDGKTVTVTKAADKSSVGVYFETRSASNVEGLMVITDASGKVLYEGTIIFDFGY